MHSIPAPDATTVGPLRGKAEGFLWTLPHHSHHVGYRVKTSLKTGAPCQGRRGVVVGFRHPTAMEALMMPPLTFLAALSLAATPTAACLALGEVRACVRSGRGRHRRTPPRGRHAARGGAR